MLVEAVTINGGTVPGNIPTHMHSVRCVINCQPYINDINDNTKLYNIFG